jgi:ornithine carbamoyltransferase
MAKVKKTAIFMHCLPAKIDSEVTEDVLKGPPIYSFKTG